MRFEEKYTNDSAKAGEKILLEKEAYAVCELLEKILDKLEHTRLTNNGR